MELGNIMRELAKRGVDTFIKYSSEHDQICLSLNTQTKSELDLYEDGNIRGRYNYQNLVCLTDDIDSIISKLCYEFKDSMYGRPYYNEDWKSLCEENNIKLDI